MIKGEGVPLMLNTAKHRVMDVTPVVIERSIAEWLKCYLGDLLGLEVDEIDSDVTFDRYGLDSLATVSMASDLEAWLGYEVDAAAPYDYPCIRSLARELAADGKLRACCANRFGG